MNIKRLADLDGKKLGVFCNECFTAVEQEIKDKRFVEEYKGNKIYSLDGNYAPYWECQYYFKSLEDVRVRIDNNHLAYVNPDMFRVL
jgi:hypothetical protein